MDIPDRPLYKFLSVDGNLAPTWQDRLAALLSGKCYLPSAADFNDPFDCLPYVEKPVTPRQRAEWSDHMVPLIADAVRQQIPADFAHPWARNVVDRMSDSELIGAIRKSSREMAAGMGVFCVAECIDSVLMWSHYASNHQGIALRFEFGSDPLLSPVIWKVKYQDQRPILRHTDFAVESMAIPIALATKATFWQYEQEWRIMLTGYARRTMTFDPKAITGIILGARCPDAVVDHAKGLAASHGLHVAQMVPDESTFQLILQDVDLT